MYTLNWSSEKMTYLGFNLTRGTVTIQTQLLYVKVDQDIRNDFERWAVTNTKMNLLPGLLFIISITTN